MIFYSSVFLQNYISNVMYQPVNPKTSKPLSFLLPTSGPCLNGSFALQHLHKVKDVNGPIWAGGAEHFRPARNIAGEIEVEGQQGIVLETSRG
jgi:hypothetical protein